MKRVRVCYGCVYSVCVASIKSPDPSFSTAHCIYCITQTIQSPMNFQTNPPSHDKKVTRCLDPIPNAWLIDVIEMYVECVWC